MRSVRLALALTTALSAVSVTSTHGQTAADSASIAAFYGRWFGSTAQSATAYASFYAPDGYLLPPGAPPVVGRAAIATWFEQSRSASPYTVQPQGINIDEIRFLSPEWVIYRGTLRGQRIPKAGGSPVPFETKYLDLLRRLPNGEWEVSFRMWSDNR